MNVINHTRKGPLNEMPWRLRLEDDRARHLLTLSDELLTSHSAAAQVTSVRSAIVLTADDAHWLRDAVRGLLQSPGGEESILGPQDCPPSRLRVEDDRDDSGYFTLSDERMTSFRSDARLLSVTSAIDFTTEEAMWLVAALDLALPEPEKRASCP